MTRIALVEPYLGGSHAAWADGYARHSSCDIEVFGLPAIHWKWRMQGGHVTLAPLMNRASTARGAFDAILASDMANVTGLLGLLRRGVGDPAVVLYMHENQLTFPRAAHDDEDLTYAMTNWTSMLASDVVAFNSEFHRDEWFTALPALLRRMPDQRHTALIDEVRGRSVVLPVGLDLAAIDAVSAEAPPRPLLLWNQRWEWDKGPDVFVDAVVELLGQGVDLDIAVAGECVAETSSRDRLRDVAGDRLVHEGHADDVAYRQLLRRADIVVSTARHEFFGIAILEAIRAGAMPVLPDRLVYPEHVPDALRSRCLYDTIDDLVDRVAWAASHRNEAREVAAGFHVVTDQFAWPIVAAQYDDVIAARHRP